MSNTGQLSAYTAPAAPFTTPAQTVLMQLQAMYVVNMAELGKGRLPAHMYARGLTRSEGP